MAALLLKEGTISHGYVRFDMGVHLSLAVRSFFVDASLLS